jgi:hypothetical protein
VVEANKQVITTKAQTIVFIVIDDNSF